MPDGGWRVAIADDHRTAVAHPEAVVAVRRGGLATSSTTRRTWLRQGVPQHHVVDPRTGLPAEVVWRTATVATTTCVDANTAATAAIVLGREAPTWLAGRGLHARLVSASGEVLAGGYGGVWPPASRTGDLTVVEAPGVAVFRTPQGCGVHDTARILAYLASASARQRGPCMFGLPAIAADFAAGVSGQALDRLRRRLPVVTGRGACAHPDGAVRMAASALDVFAHATGAGCLDTTRRTA